MSLIKKPKTGAGIASLLREAGRKAKIEAEQKSRKEIATLDEGLVIDATPKDTRLRPYTPKIFSVIDYIEAEWGLKMTLFPVQRFIVKLYYNIPLEDKERTIKVTDMFNTRTLFHLTEKEYLKYLFEEGRCNFGEQDHDRRQLILSIGRRAGKTTLSSLFASYEVYRLLNLHDPQAYYGLPGGNTIQIISVATDKDQAGILFREVSGHLSRCAYFAPYILSNNLSRIDFQTPADIEKFGPVRQQDGKFASLNGKSSIRVTFKSAIAKGLRGMGNIVVILDEMAHFLDDGSTSAEEVYKAVTPSMAAFSPKSPDESLPADERAVGPVESRLICISSPLNKQGKFYDLFQTAMAGGPASKNMIAIQGPTWEVNPTVPADYYEQKYHEDPATFMIEHGAEFSDRIRGWIERAIDLEVCIDPEMLPKLRGLPRAPHQMGIDVGIVNDGTAIVITHVENGVIVVDYHEIWYAGVDWREANPHLGESYPTAYAKTLAGVDRLDVEEIANWVDVLCRRFYITEGIFDRWEGLSLEQQLHKRGLKQFSSEFFTTALKSQMYQAMKLLMFDQSLRLYDYPVPADAKSDSSGKKPHSPLITELLELQATQQSKNVIVVEAPQTAGKHDDMSDALVRSVWLSMKHLGKSYGADSRHRPVVSRGTSLAAYQLARARSHGGFSPRTVPGRLGSRRFR